MEMQSRPNVNSYSQTWNYLRAVYFMMRKGLLSKRKFISMEIQLMIKRSAGKLILPGKSTRAPFEFQIPHGMHACEYEFSCSDTPHPVFLNLKSKLRRHIYFSCIGSAAAEDDRDESPCCAVDLWSTCNTPAPDNRAEDEVDDRAEKFIRRFYQQLNAQCQLDDCGAC
ncbi:hypothetical protein HPP92_008070 [Vanilla planifolia]|uniref:Uncharacterized protein n=1 Tax=Vanilla planifolia TaxID=51239 RepID=A0A835RSN1_VANPL|nr:hypothetical protein HPP92_008070 [Vanilla planifolia]